jgi:predicted regulator of Ras-like GTPase activity (Roadblock/LC7/MglB family)
MPYQSLLDNLVRSVDGAAGAVLMDSEGEVVVEAGDGSERHRLIGAYQGIALARLRNAGERCETGVVQYVHCRYSDGHVVLRPLKDGYYMVLSLGAGANLGQALHRSAETQTRVNAEL